MTETRQIVVPGEVVGTTESHAPGQNTYLEGRSIRALRLGVKSVRGNVLNVISLNGRYEPGRGDMVIGTAQEAGPSNWYIDIGAANDVGMHVNDVPWRVEFGETSKYIAIGETVLLKIVHVDEMKKAQVSMKDRQCRKLTGGLIWEVAPTKVPRIVGRNGSMIALIKDYTSVRIFVGQNGRVWLDGEAADVTLALEALHKIEAEAHTTGLTDRMKAWFEDKRPGAAANKKPAAEDETPVESGEEFKPRRERRERPRMERSEEEPVDLDRDREMRRERAGGPPSHERHHSDRRAAPHHGPHEGRREQREERERPRRSDERDEPRGRSEDRPARDEPRGAPRRFEERPPPRRSEEREERAIPRREGERPRRFEEARGGRRTEGDAEPRFGGERPARPRRDEPRSAPRREADAEPQFGGARAAPRRFEEPQFGGERAARPMREDRPAPRRFEDEERPARPAPRRFEDEDRRARPMREDRPAPRRFEDEDRPARPMRDEPRSAMRREGDAEAQFGGARAPPRRFDEERPRPKARFDDDDDRPAPKPRFEEPRSGRGREGDAEPAFGGERARPKPRFDDEADERAPVRKPRFPDEPAGSAPRSTRFGDDDEESDDRPSGREERGGGDGGSRRRRGGRGRGRGNRSD
ncbi:MAG TPA: exosome complex RNA-binding protein Rrp4 [Candidatus Thermoplasmatota archaeon]|nr:exosome complex RNA-binding protein Rrp4 [Candidatus Thermoplasmatota archaeon]